MKTFGSDPEFMIFKDGEPKSAIGILPSDENRTTINGHQFYYDNVMAECAVKPGKSKEEVIQNFRECIQTYIELVKPCVLKNYASVMYDDNQLLHEDARKVNCAKDFCAYEMKQKDGPVDQITNGNLRSCGGHIHLGADSLVTNGPEPILTVYMMDLFLGIPSLWLDKDPTSPRRRLLYGHAGRYRIKDYGIEYRSLGNFWLESPEMVGLIYDLTMFSLDFVESGRAWDMWEFDIERCFESGNLADCWKCRGYDTNVLMSAINKGSTAQAAELFEMAKSLMPSGLKRDLLRMIDRSERNLFSLSRNWQVK